MKIENGTDTARGHGDDVQAQRHGVDGRPGGHVAGNVESNSRAPAALPPSRQLGSWCRPLDCCLGRPPAGVVSATGCSVTLAAGSRAPARARMTKVLMIVFILFVNIR